MKEIITRDKQILIKQIKEYINIIRNEYNDYVQVTENIDLDKIVHIKDVGTISLFIRNGEFYFPIEAYKVFEELKKDSKFGTNRNHQTYNNETLLINNNNFLDYIEHLILIGATPLDYFQEITLHETMHFCGSNGGSALMEGLNEYLTRLVALKYNLKTNGCGYPKEIKIIQELVNLFGIDIMTKLAFSKTKSETLEIFKDEEKANLIIELNALMDEEFYGKYYKFKYPGLNGPFEKAKRYEEIDYSNAMKLIEEYKTKNSVKR